MKITKIEAQVKTRGRFSIFVDGKFEFGLSELGLINSGLGVGQELSKAELESFKDKSKTDKIYNQTLGLIARRPRSEWEVEDYLKRKGHETEIRQEILNLLRKINFINDVDFARRWVESRRLLKNVSQRKLRMELKQKRVSEEIIDVVLAEDQTDELEIIKAEIAKKRRQTRYQDDQKMMAYLARQGYLYQDIKQALTDQN